MCRLLLHACFLATLSFALPAWALNQPGSTAPLPYIDETVAECSNNNVQRCLDDEEGEPGLIDAREDGGVTPETFDPTCSLDFHLVTRGADFRNIFGWYNVKNDPDRPGKTLKPELGELHAFILNDEEAPLTRALELRNDPNYAGGLIGFFIATGHHAAVEAPDGATIEERLGKPPRAGTFDNIFYSERAFNPDNGDTPSIHLITWQSVAHKDSFYFGWEDLLVGGDDDFDDILTRVDGIQCAGGGDACKTGDKGVCALGTMQCQRGELTCVPDNEASDESCNALDDDCDGKVDDGDLCQEDHVCYRGKCVPRCGSAEFACKDGLVCNSAGFCVEPACADVKCPEGKVCEGGECVDGCQDVKCPFDQICRLGRCVDPCENVECDPEFSCHLGVCVDCDCSGCDRGFSCESNVCIEDACESVSCKENTHCVDGKCLDDCDDVRCPGGAECSKGTCGEPEPKDANGGSGGTISVTVDPATNGGGGAGGTTDPYVVALNSSDSAESRTSNCACRTPGRGTSASAAGLGALALLSALMFGRRSRRKAA